MLTPTRVHSRRVVKPSPPTSQMAMPFKLSAPTPPTIFRPHRWCCCTVAQCSRSSSQSGIRRIITGLPYLKKFRDQTEQTYPMACTFQRAALPNISQSSSALRSGNAVKYTEPLAQRTLPNLRAPNGRRNPERKTSERSSLCSKASPGSCQINPDRRGTIPFDGILVEVPTKHRRSLLA